MIDATKAPTPTWKRYAMAMIVTVLLVVAGYVIWAKELHHSSGGAAAPSATTGNVATAPAGKKASATSLPGGIAISGRNPFGN
jgi:hypothetical protein